MATNQPENREQYHFRVEAAQMLGIVEPEDTKPQ